MASALPIERERERERERTDNLSGKLIALLFYAYITFNGAHLDGQNVRGV